MFYHVLNAPSPHLNLKLPFRKMTDFERVAKRGPKCVGCDIPWEDVAEEKSDHLETCAVINSKKFLSDPRIVAPKFLPQP